MTLSGGLCDVMMLCCAVGSYDPEWRAMWIATVYNIDWPLSSGDSSGEQQQQLLSYLDMAQQLNFNAIVFQGDPPTTRVLSAAVTTDHG